MPPTPAHPHTRGANGRGVQQGGPVLRPIPTRVGHTSTQTITPEDLARPIPTRVGQTAAMMLPCGLSPAHPHTRGANVGQRLRLLVHKRPIPTRVGQTSIINPTRVAALGPSPHAWGKRVIAVWLRQHSTAHPHTRGANAAIGRTQADEFRPIPTRVGQTLSRRRHPWCD